MITILNVKIKRDELKIKALNNFKAYSAYIMLLANNLYEMCFI